MTASAPAKASPRSSVRMLASTQLVFGGVQAGSRRANPTIFSISEDSLKAWTVLVPTLPVAPVTTTFILARLPWLGSGLARSERDSSLGPLGISTPKEREENVRLALGAGDLQSQRGSLPVQALESLQLAARPFHQGIELEV